MNIEFETNFLVMPTDANHMSPLIFGGAFFSKMDLCAACTVDQALKLSPICKAAVTHKAEVTWSKPCYVGDIVFLKGKVIELGKKSIVVSVVAHRQKRASSTVDYVGEGKFVFVSIEHVEEIASKPDLLPYKQHGIEVS